MDTEETQKVLKWARITLIVLAVFLAIETLGELKDLRSIDPTYHSISVSGVGEAIAVPDVAIFSFTVSADAKEAGDAQRQVTEKMNSILAGLKAMDIKETDIKTTDYSLWPKYVSDEQVVCLSLSCPPLRQIQDGYTASHSVSVEIKETGNAGKALAFVGSSGATGISNISFTVDDPGKVVDEARAKAIRDAREKAKLLTKALGVRLVRVVSFYDNTGGEVPYYAEGLGGDSVRVSALTPTIPTGENKVTVNVMVTYEIR